MEARELRIGNYIYWDIPEKENVVHTVIGIDKGKPKTLPISLGTIIEEYKPIPLTEEWLLKFGFKEVKNEPRQWFRIKTKKLSVYLEISLKEKRATLYKDNYNCYSDCVFPKYVHQLQNLYFALTGEELTTQELNQ